MALKIKTGDTVKIITGKDKGKTGTVKAVEPKRNRLFVEGMNMMTRHRAPRSIRDTQGGGSMEGISHHEGPIHISNVMLLDPKSGDATRVGVKREDGLRKRIAKRSGEEID
jgi:large subunit ribosomal protein L24